LKIGDLVEINCGNATTFGLMGIVIDVNENPSPGLEPMPYRVRWFNPPDGHPEVQSRRGKWLEVVSESR